MNILETKLYQNIHQNAPNCVDFQNIFPNPDRNGCAIKFSQLKKCRIWGGFLIRRSSAIRRFFAGFPRCDSTRKLMRSFLKKVARELSVRYNIHFAE